MIQLIGLLWEAVVSSLSWLPPFCQSVLVAAGSALAVIAIIVLVGKLTHIIK